MFRSYWIIAIALGLITIAFLVLFSWSYLHLYQVNHAKQRQNAAQYAASASANNVQRCFDIGSLSICYGKTVQAIPEEKYTQYDLEAQQDMAEWTYALLLLTVAGTVIGGFGLIALFWSLWQTRTSIIDTREIGEAQVRAYLGFKVTEIQVEVGKPVEAIVNITNHGQSPANSVDVTFVMVIRPIDWSWDSEDSEEPEGERTSRVIFPGNEHAVHMDKTPEGILTKCEFNRIFKTESAIYGRVMVDYVDTFDRAREALFSFDFSGKKCIELSAPRISPTGHYDRKRK